MKCPHCGCDPKQISAGAMASWKYALCKAQERGGFIWESCREAYESGKYKDPEIAELLAAGLLIPHDNPKYGWVPVNP